MAGPQATGTQAASALPTGRSCWIPAVAPSDERAFQQGFAVVRELVGIQRWSGAKRQLDELLDRHARASYVLPFVAEIAELYELLGMKEEARGGFV